MAAGPVAAVIRDELRAQRARILGPGAPCRGHQQERAVVGDGHRLAGRRLAAPLGAPTERVADGLDHLERREDPFQIGA